MNTGATNGGFALTLSSGSFATVTGTLAEVVNVTSVVDFNLPNEFNIQINTNRFNSSLCGNIQKCAWMQFVYDSGGGINIQAWLLSYAQANNSTCPKPFSVNGPDCQYKPATNNLSILTLEQLSGMSLIVNTNDNGQISLNAKIGSENITPVTMNDLLGLASNWSSAEINVFAESSRMQAVFNPGALVRIAMSGVASDSKDRISCAFGPSNSGETTNLSFVSGCEPQGTGGFSFLEGTAPVVNEIAPDGSPIGGGGLATISGQGLTGGMVAQIGGSTQMCELGVDQTGANACLIHIPPGTGTVGVSLATQSANGEHGPLSPSLPFIYFAKPAPISCTKCGDDRCCANPNGGPLPICISRSLPCPSLN